MKILQLIPDFDLGGVQKAGVVLAKYFRRGGHEVAVFAQRTGPRIEELRRHRIPVLTCSEHTGLRRAIDELAPDVLHVHGEGYEDRFVQSVIRAAGTRPLVVTPVFGRVPADRSILSRVTTCCVGLYTHARFCKWLGSTPRRAVHKGIVFAELTPYEDPELQSEVASLTSLPKLEEGSVVFGRIGRAHPHKWHPRSEDMVSHILATVPNAIWVSVGWPEGMSLAAMREKWGTRFVNYSETADFGVLQKVLERLDLHLFASRFGECFSSTICEAASIGTPTLAMLHPFNDAGEIEQVIEGVTGWLVHTPDKFQSRAVELLRQPQLLARMRGSSREYARANWHVDVVGAHVLAIYEATIRGQIADYGATLDYQRAEKFAPIYRAAMLAVIRGRFPGPIARLVYFVYHNGRTWRASRQVLYHVRRLCGRSTPRSR